MRSKLPVSLSLLLLASSTAPAAPNVGFLFDALNRRRDAVLSPEEFGVFLDPPQFRKRVLRQVRYKMGFFGKLPGMRGLLARAGGEPPFAKKNHADWVATYDRDRDGALGPAERAAAAEEIFAVADADRDGALSRDEFAELLARRRRKLAD